MSSPICTPACAACAASAPAPARIALAVMEPFDRFGMTAGIRREAGVAIDIPGKIALVSDNPAYRTIELDPDEVQVIGRVVWKSGRL